MHLKTIIFVVGVGTGIIVGEVSMVASEIAIFGLILAVIQLGIYLIQKRSGAVGATSLFTLLFCIGLFIGIIRVQSVVEKTNYECVSSCTFDAKIISTPETKDEYQIFKVHAVESGTDVYDVQIRVPLYPTYQIGDIIKLSGKVTEPKLLFPHGDKKSFDYASYLQTKNVGSEMFYPKVEVIDTEANTITEKLGRFKVTLVDTINLYVSAPASTLASGMLFGASAISKELTQTFRTAGLSHIVVLSGFNIVILIAGVLFVLTFLPLLLRIITASLVVILFVMMVGGEASVIRATLMAFITLLATLLGRQYVAKQALIISLLLIILYEPYSLLHDVSLHLSFLATAGIVYMSELFGNLFQKIQSNSFREMIITTLSAYLATLPYVMYTFGTVSVYALIANVLALPFVPIAMLVTFLVIVFSYIANILATIFGFIDTVLINIVIWVARTIEHLPFSTFTLTISFPIMCLVYIFIATTLIYFYQKNKNETQITREDGMLTGIIHY